jgi:hypothetical protein
VYVNEGVALGLAYPVVFAAGYDFQQRIDAAEGLNVIIDETILVLGLDQGLFLPSVNVVAGVSLGNLWELGVGANASAGVRPFHMVAVAGLQKPYGRVYFPVHLSFVPDVDGNFRVAVTAGVNW